MPPDLATAKRRDLPPRRALRFAPSLEARTGPIRGRRRALWLSLCIAFALAGCGPPGPIDYRPGPYNNMNPGPSSP